MDRNTGLYNRTRSVPQAGRPVIARRHSCSGRRRGLLLAAAVLLFPGCGEQGDDAESGADVPVKTATASDSEWMTVAELRAALRANDKAEFRRVGSQIVEVSLIYSGVEDITPLKGLPLRFLDLGFIPVEDLTPLQGMPLETLWLERDENNTGPTIDNDDLAVLKGMPLKSLKIQNTNVSDISSLAGMQLEEFNLFGTQVADISPLAGMPLKSLWLRKTPVTDISPLKGMRLVSLDLRQTGVTSLEALRGMTSLKRLNIAETPITDLTPLEGMRLERLVFTADNITKGLEIVRSMDTIRVIGPTLEEAQNLTVEGFWRQYDADHAPKEAPPAITPPTEGADKPADDGAPDNDKPKEPPAKTGESPTSPKDATANSKEPPAATESKEVGSVPDKNKKTETPDESGNKPAAKDTAKPDGPATEPPISEESDQGIKPGDSGHGADKGSTDETPKKKSGSGV